jgi:3-methylfumaryl-CoA hydratase
MRALQDWVGRSESRRDEASAGAAARFAATIGGPATSPGTAVPPGFHWCLCLPDAPLGELGPDGHPRTGGFLPPVPLPRRMWAASELEFRAPIRVGARIERASTVAAVTEKAGRSGAMVFVAVDHVTRADGVDAVHERQTIVYREASAQAVPLPEPRAVDTAAWPVARSLVPDATLLFRYSALTFNSHRIHYDLPYATREEHYPALVVQGPLTATLLLELAARQCGGEAIARFSFRAVAPAFAEQSLHLLGRPSATAIELTALGADGRTVMEALAELRR